MIAILMMIANSLASGPASAVPTPVVPEAEVACCNPCICGLGGGLPAPKECFQNRITIG